MALQLQKKSNLLTMLEKIHVDQGYGINVVYVNYNKEFDLESSFGSWPAGVVTRSLSLPN